MNDCGHDLRDTDCPTCLATLAADPYDRADPGNLADIFAELNVPFTDGSNS